MAGTIALSITGSFSGGAIMGTGNLVTSTLTNTSNIEYIQNVTLANGANTITVPSGVKGFYLIMSSTNTFTVTIKGVSGDTGVQILPTGWLGWTFPSSPPANFVITTSGATSCEIVWV